LSKRSPSLSKKKSISSMLSFKKTKSETKLSQEDPSPTSPNIDQLEATDSSTASKSNYSNMALGLAMKSIQSAKNSVDALVRPSSASHSRVGSRNSLRKSKGLLSKSADVIAPVSDTSAVESLDNKNNEPKHMKSTDGLETTANEEIPPQRRALSELALHLTQKSILSAQTSVDHLAAPASLDRSRSKSSSLHSILKSSSRPGSQVGSRKNLSVHFQDETHSQTEPESDNQEFMHSDKELENFEGSAHASQSGKTKNASKENKDSKRI
jgi:hypothetical protein